MYYLNRLVQWIQKRNRYCKLALSVGFGTMVCLYITALFAHTIAPHTANYLNAMRIYYAALEVAPVCFAAGVSAAVITDLAFCTYAPQDDDVDPKD